uniref:Steroid 5-alpha reductase C-terminal domain-containing protein n=1 Tax=Sinocyclocheilus grahami TaxID=75366 RepID=A0A672K4N1_SINGR
MLCQENTIHYCSWTFVVGGVLYLLRQITTHTPYGRYVDTKSPGMMVPAKAGWFIQELPSFLVPVLLFLTTESLPGIGRHFLLWTFCLHYFQRLLHIRPCTLYISGVATIFKYGLNHINECQIPLWRLFPHTLCCSCCLPKIPAVDNYNKPGQESSIWRTVTLSIIIKGLCFYLMYYMEKFKDYPKSRKAVIPFLL